MECSRRKKTHGCGSLQLVAKALTCRGLDQVNPTDTRVTPHCSPLMIILFRVGHSHWVMDIQPFLSTLPNFLIPKVKDKFTIWHWQQDVHGTSFINVPTCMSALAVWFENFSFLGGMITFFYLEVYKLHFTQSLKGKKNIFFPWHLTSI